MARRSIVTLVSLLVVVLALVLWVARGSRGDPHGSALAAVEAVAPSSDPSASKQAGVAPDLDVPVATSTTNAPATARAVATPVVADLVSAELADAKWVEGRIVFPNDTPVDESVVVVAQGREFERSKKMHKAAVDRDGHFRVAFSPKTTKGWLRLEARYLYLDKNFEVKPDAPPDAIVLSPLVGGGFRGKLVLSNAALPFAAELVGATINAAGWQSDTRSPRQVGCKVDANLEFVLGGLQPGMNWSLQFNAKGFCAEEPETPSVQKGALQTLDLAVSRGARISGRVLDEAGAPIAKAAVRTSWSMDGSWGSENEVRTQADGSFQLVGVRAGKLRVEADLDGYARTRLDETEFHDGDDRANVSIVLTRGNCVAGVVHWPDGKPAADVKVDVQEPPEEHDQGSFTMFGDHTPSARTAADGSFTITGLRAGPYKLSARSTPKEVATTLASPAKDGARKTAKARFTVELDDVQTNQKGLVLTLQSGASLRGRVVDDLGQPLASASVRGMNKADGEFGFTSSSSSILKATTDADGRFELLGLKDGAWEITAQMRNGPESDLRTLTIPGDDTQLDLIVKRPATIAGFVVDPAGTAVAGARIFVDDRVDERFPYVTNDREKMKTDDKGHFRAENLRAGKVSVRAEHPDWAQSLELEFDLAPSQIQEPVTLRLLRGGTIAGLVQDATGQPAAGRKVSLWSRSQTWRSATSAADGTFRFERVPPGKVHIAMQQRESRVSGLETVQVTSATAEDFNSRKTVVAIDGAVVDVVLGGPGRAPLRLFGVVSAGGRPVAGASVSAFSNALDDGNGSREATTNAEGRYEIALSQPGEYNVNVRSKGGSSAGIKKTIPAGASFELDLRLPSGRISGRVVSEAGAPLARVDVQMSRTLRANEDQAEDQELSTRWSSTRTGADGTFDFDLLGEGKYTLTATMQDDRQGNGRTNPNGRAKLTDLALTNGQQLEGVELRMPRAGTITGVVLDPGGSPLAGVRVMVRDEKGERVSPWSGSESDAAGRFKVTGLPPGTLKVSASSERFLTRAAQSVAVQSNATSEVTLQLEQASAVRVIVEGGSGELLNVWVGAEDEEGHHAAHASFNSRAARVASPQECLLGPLTAGTYTIKLHHENDTESQQKVTVDGHSDQTVRFARPK